MFFTIVGKILKGIGKVVGIAGAAAAVIGTGGALAGILPAVAAGTGILGKVFKGVSKVSKAAVNLATGTTKEERDQVKGVKQEAKAAQDKLEQVDRLIQAGATRSQAEKMVGINQVELGSADAEVKDKEKEIEAGWTLKYKNGATVTGGPGTLPDIEGKGCLVNTIIILGSMIAAGTTALILL